MSIERPDCSVLTNVTFEKFVVTSSVLKRKTYIMLVGAKAKASQYRYIHISSLPLIKVSNRLTFYIYIGQQ